MVGDSATDDLCREITELTGRLSRAIADADAARIRSFLSDDFSMTTAGWLDTPADRETWIADVLGRFRLDAFVFDDVRVRRYDDVVVAQSRCRQQGLDLATGAPWAMVFRYTDVWLRDDPTWRMAVRQATGRPWTVADGPIEPSAR